MWVPPAHNDIEKNEKADVLAERTELKVYGLILFCGISNKMANIRIKYYG